MTPAELAAYVRLKTRTNSTTLTNADLLILGNKVKSDICQRALETDEDIFLVPTYLDLVEDQREYPMHSNILSRIKRVEVNFTDETDDYTKLKSFDLAGYDNPVTGETNIINHFANFYGKCFYDIMRKSIFIYSGSIIDVTDGVRIWVNTWPANIATMAGTTDMSVDPSTTTHGIPKELHSVLAKGMIIEWKESQEKPIPLTQSEENYEFSLEKAIQTLKKADYDREVIGKLPDRVTFHGEDGSEL